MSDKFLDLGIGSLGLYLVLGLHADDYGFVANPKSLTRLSGASDDDLRALIAKGFVIPFEDKGVIVITHWNVNNKIRKDRVQPTAFQCEYQQLELIDGIYVRQADGNQMATIRQPDDNQMTTIRQPDDNQMTTKCQAHVSIVQDRLGKVNITQQHQDSYVYKDNKNTLSDDNCQDGLPTDLQELSTILTKHGVKGEEIVKSFFADRDETYYQIKAFSEKTETEWRSIKNPTAYFINAVKNKYRPPVANSEKNKKQPDPNCEYCGGTGYRQSEPFMGETHKCVCKCCQ